MDAGRLLYILLFLSSNSFVSLRSEITRVVFVNLFRLNIPPNFCAHSVNLVFYFLATRQTGPFVGLPFPQLTGNARRLRVFDVHFLRLALWADLFLAINEIHQGVDFTPRQLTRRQITPPLANAEDLIHAI